MPMQILLTSFPFQSAGKDSDVFVVPNLNVKYESVDLVYWDNSDGKCGPKLGESDAFPTVVLFDLEAPSSEPALTFYSRKHIETTKIPEIEKAIIGMEMTVQKVRTKLVICCPATAGSCEGDDDTGTFRKCDDDDLEYEQEGLDVLEAALAAWTTSLQGSNDVVVDAIEKGNAIVDWFMDEDVGQKGMYQDEYNTGKMSITDFSVNLAPDLLIDDAKLTPDGKKLLNVTDSKQSIEKIKTTKRIQFSGSSGAYELSLDKTRYYYSAAEDCNQNTPLGVASQAILMGAQSGLGLAALPIAAGAMIVSSAIGGCNYEIDPEIALGNIDVEGKAFGIGVQGQIGGGKFVSTSTSQVWF
jgi:hypothetical protein